MVQRSSHVAQGEPLVRLVCCGRSDSTYNMVCVPYCDTSNRSELGANSGVDVVVRPANTSTQ